MFNFIKQEKLLTVIIFLSLILILIYLYDIILNNNRILNYDMKIEKIEVKESILDLPKLDGPIF